jgi:predicted DNA binding protein
VEWAPDGKRVAEAFDATAGTVVEVHGTAEQWRLRTLFPDRPIASETYRTWHKEGVQPTLGRIDDISDGSDGRMGLSPTQHRVVLEAFRSGYYDVPRETTLAELAAEFDVSHQALSECLRRGHSTLVERMLSPTTPGVVPP